MSRLITVNEPYKAVVLPNGSVYDGPAEVVLTNDQYARLSPRLTAGDDPIVTVGEAQPDDNGVYARLDSANTFGAAPQVIDANLPPGDFRSIAEYRAAGQTLARVVAANLELAPGLTILATGVGMHEIDFDGETPTGKMGLFTYGFSGVLDELPVYGFRLSYTSADHPAAPTEGETGATPLIGIRYSPELVEALGGEGSLAVNHEGLMAVRDALQAAIDAINVTGYDDTALSGRVTSLEAIPVAVVPTQMAYDLDGRTDPEVTVVYDSMDVMIDSDDTDPIVPTFDNPGVGSYARFTIAIRTVGGLPPNPTWPSYVTVGRTPAGGLGNFPSANTVIWDCLVKGTEAGDPDVMVTAISLEART